MKFSAVVLKPRLIKKNYKGKNNALIISFISISVGIICAVVVFQLNIKIISDNLINFFVRFVTDFSNKSFFEMWGGILISNLPYVLIMLILGTCSLGAIPVITVNFFCSYGIGSLTAYIMSNYGLKGFEYFLLVIFPGKVIQILAMMIICENGIKSSNLINQSVIKGVGEKLAVNEYITVFGIGAILVILSSFVDCITVKLFSSLFTLS